MISGRRGAPGRLGALYRPVRGVPYGIGSYEPAVSGTPDAPGAAEQTLIGVVQVMAPAGPYTVWAEKAGSSDFAEQSPRNRLLYVLNEQQILASEKLIGEPPAYLAFLADRPGDSGTIAGMFADSRYKWSKTEAVYSQADPNRVPKISFLHWAELRPMSEWKGRSATERAVATRIGAVLVFPIAAASGPGDREPPQSTFVDAMKAQFPSGGAALPQVVDGPESSSNARLVSGRDAARSTLLLLGLFGAGAVALWAGYQVTRRMQRTAA